MTSQGGICNCDVMLVSAESVSPCYKSASTVADQI